MSRHFRKYVTMSPATMPNAPKTFYSKKTPPSSSEMTCEDLLPELTTPKLSARKMLTCKDLLNVDPHTLVMALKSGFLAESAWALDTLNIMLKDDLTMSFCQLASLPSLLGVLVEYWRDIMKYRNKYMKNRSEDAGSKLATRHDVDDVSDDNDKQVLLDTVVKSVTYKNDMRLVECDESDCGFIVRFGDGKVLEDQGGAVLNVKEDVEMMMRKGSVLTTIMRNLSFVPGNEEFMGSASEFLAMCGKVLTRKEMIMDWQDEEEMENVMIILSNIALYTDLSKQPSHIVWDILTSLLHWIVSDQAMDINILTLTMSVQKIALEILCKLCLNHSNVDLLLATPKVTLKKLCHTLASNLINQDEPIKVMSISIIYYIVSSSSTWSTTISQTTHTIPLLISLIEQAVEQAEKRAKYQGLADLRDNPSIMGTNIDTLRRAANTLSLLAQQDISSNIFMVEEERLVKLAMSPVLDQEVAKSICEAMFLSSRVYESGRRRWVDIQ